MTEVVLQFVAAGVLYDFLPSEEKTVSLFDIMLQHRQSGVEQGVEQLLNDGANLMVMVVELFGGGVLLILALTISSFVVLFRV